MSRPYTSALSVCLLVAGGSDHEVRLTKLEKKNQELRDEVEKNAAYDLQSKSAGGAKAWFNDTWSGDKDTIILELQALGSNLLGYRSSLGSVVERSFACRHLGRLEVSCGISFYLDAGTRISTKKFNPTLKC